ncbi:Pimeloyl-ACP methyl ester carboxylesterase [Microbispora rosea]|uniref:Pimeloyl-ACP methyl ester carboxylesterase n=1 Tax=Microbispora rosea TaxID=58117 RepID=A0A1N7H476_9ACTN|nr:alpha/beta hydrolase [Microbispora rosea]GIH44867.1 lysophospholipase [Microbispora rosea subsp. rosea]SIS19488.1 Pimeloyl-ACP methyl ester carboxylesterase [Microbispora rosea]
MSMPVVFVHGIRLSGTMWSPVRALLRAPSAAPDLPGHGRRRGLPYGTEAACDVVAETIAGLGGRALVVGLSLGGYVGIATAARHPDLVAGLVAMGCTARPDRPRAHAYRLAGRLAARNPALVDRVSRFALRRMLPGAAGEAMIEGGLSSEVVASVVAAVTAEDPLASLAAYPGRVWLLNGARDPFRVDESAFLRACADGSLTHLHGRGHLTVLADPAGLARFIDKAAEDVSACPA